jgi:hypothetical protein
MGNQHIAFVALLLLIGITGCANLNYQPPIDSNVNLGTEKSYIYGKFNLTRDFLNQVRLALQIEKKSDGKLLSLRLIDEKDVYAIELEPGTYQLKGFIYAPLGAMMEFETRKIPLPNSPSYLNQPFLIERGKAYYIGDYYGSSKRTGGLLVPNFVMVTFQGGIVGIDQNFEKTSKELQTSLPAMGSIETRTAWDVKN